MFPLEYNPLNIIISITHLVEEQKQADQSLPTCGLQSTYWWLVESWLVLWCYLLPVSSCYAALREQPLSLMLNFYAGNYHGGVM